MTHDPTTAGGPEKAVRKGSPSTRRAVALGRGITVTGAPEGRVLVESSRLPLPWRGRQGSFPGTAVDWDGRLMEVVRTDGEGHRFLLDDWPAQEVARTACALTRTWVDGLAAEIEETKRAKTIRTILVTFLPLVGLLPGKAQEYLERNYNYPACTGTIASCLLEFPIAGIGILQTFLLTAGGGWIMPPGTRWIRFLAIPLLAEAFIRLHYTIGHREPIGSFLFFVFGLRGPEEQADPRDDYRAVPVDRKEDGVDLLLAVKKTRPDWFEDGILSFRGKTFRLDGRPREESGTFVYPFIAVAEPECPNLRLVPPTVESTGPPQAEYGPVALATRNLLFAFAPARYQETWFARHGGSIMTLSLASASLETFAGLYALLTQPARGFLGLVDLLILCDGLFRLGAMLISRGPAGSVFGLPFLGLYRQWTGPGR